MPVQAVALVLGEHADPADTPIDQVGQRKIHQPVQAAEGNSCFGPVRGQRRKALTCAACQNHSQDPLSSHVHLPALSLGCQRTPASELPGKSGAPAPYTAVNVHDQGSGDQGRCGPGPKLMLVSAPAGFGKTTLLGRTRYEYVSEQGYRCRLRRSRAPSGPATPIDYEDGETAWRDTRTLPGQYMT